MHETTKPDSDELGSHSEKDMTPGFRDNLHCDGRSAAAGERQPLVG
jgi:hypothetical protein